MFSFGKKIVGIDIHDYSAKLVQLRHQNNTLILEAYNRKTFPAGVIRNGDIIQEEECKTILKSLIETANPMPVDTSNVAVIFPSTKVYSHIFSLPPTLSQKEITEALTFEAETVIPFALSEVYWDYIVLHQEEGPKGKVNKVLFAAIPRETADKYTRILEAIGLVPSIFGIDVDSLRYGILRQLKPQTYSLVIDIGTLSVNFLMLHNNQIAHFQSNTHGGKKLFEQLSQELKITENMLLEQKEQGKFDEKYLPPLQQFLRQHYEMAQNIISEKENKEVKITNIYLTGEFVNLPGFLEIAQQSFPGRQVAVGDPRSYLMINEKKFSPEVTGKQQVPYATYFLNATGIGICGFLPHSGSYGINLLPDPIRKSNRLRKWTTAMAVSSVCIALLSLITATMVFFTHQQSAYERVQLEVKKSAVDKVLYGTRYLDIKEEVILFNQEVAEVSAIEKQLFSVPEVIENVYALMPKGVTISQFTLSESELLLLEITGVAKTREDLLNAHQALKNTEFIQQIITPISNYDERYNIAFTIKLTLDFNKLPPYGAYNAKKP